MIADTRRGDSGNFEVVGRDGDGCLICRKSDGSEYNCGETLEQFGPENLTPEERRNLEDGES